ncbi:ribosomal peptide maturation radical SAM protein 1 [Methylomagnum ishizawai]|uniref:Ribosomal peptide maturation radical SAM protein 1 n=1 Tax=Methylomagnum ishizawai TaxID=1760988 RepID=A0A1Y6D9M7_9GAMM|nr:RiPP maturation radical SAM C-methyltransferase [Methylomagnum ishizawai]SMF97393.1 ribosomal peptide maturation radical SAM protein 1 [Methylomagnum ishizawai]
MIHWVQMPFGSITTPSLALGQFKAQLAEAGIESQVFPFNMAFSRMIGPGAYETIARFKGVETQIGEWLFAREAWGRDFGLPEERFIELCGDEIEGIPHVKDLPAWLRQVRHQVVPMFLDQCLERLLASGPLKVVAFSCTFFQAVASLALGRRIRERFPEVKLIYGGACFHGGMGEALARAAGWIDAISTGEADDVIVPLCRAMLAGQAPEGLQGILYRREPDGPLWRDADHRPLDSAGMERLPVPDFGDFFAEARRVGYFDDPAWRARILIPFESARGCWWGQKHHCTFCGLNGEGMSYRARSAASTLALLRALAERYPWAKRFQAADNIMPMSYFHDFLPVLAENPPRPDVEYFWTVKTNLHRGQIRQLAAARVLYLQPGIESLADNILKQMRKGVTALQNLFFLRACQEEGITVYWNNLIRIPGETAADYAQMVEWLPQLHHLRPAYGGAPKAECHRFSPYFFEAGRWTTDLRPMRWYAELFPADTVDIPQVAYYYEAEWKEVLGGDAYDALLEASARWTAAWREGDAAPRCVARPDGAGWRVEDTRPGAPGEHRLSPLAVRVLQALDTPTPRAKLAEQLPEVADAELDAVLADLLARHLVLDDGKRYLSLVLGEGTREPAPWQRSGLLKRVTNQRPAGVATV